jgi:hypothetical protein
LSDRGRTYNLSSGNLGGIGLLEVRAQYRASKAWKQCSGVHTETSVSPVWPAAGSGGMSDIKEREMKITGVAILGQVADHWHLYVF